MKLASLIPIVIIVIFSVFFRLIFLDKIPIGITNDELEYVLNAKAIFLTGKDITGTWSPLSLTAPPGFPMAELPSLIVSPFIGLMPLSLFAARLPYAVINILLVVVLYLIAKRLFDGKAAFIVGLVAAINPWSIYLGRTAFDAPMAAFFYFFGLYLLLILRGWKILFSFPIFFLAFYSYIGTKIIFIPFILFSILFVCLLSKKQYIKQYTVLFVLCLMLFLNFVLFLKHQQTVTRLGEISSPSNPAIAQEVDNQRRLSIQNPLTTFFSNKPVVFLKDSLNKYLGAFSTQLLFLYGDNQQRFTVWQHGIFYYLDFLFLGVGFYALFKRKKMIGIFFTSLIAIAPLPSVLSTVGVSYAIRSIILFPLFIIVIGIGIWHILELKKSLFNQRSLIAVIFLTYTFLIINFFNIYLFQNPIYNSEGVAFSSRVLSRYMSLANKHNQKVVLLTPKSIDLIKQYIFFTNDYNQKTKTAISKALQGATPQYKNVKITDCPSSTLSMNETMITTKDPKCTAIKNYRDNLSISQLSDGGEIYKIFNDAVCNHYQLNRYPQNFKLSDFNVEQLSEEMFCQKFITELK